MKFKTNIKIKLNKKHIVLLALVLAVAITLILAVLLLSNGYKKVAKKYVSATFKNNAEEYLECLPSNYVDAYIKQSGCSSKEEYINRVEKYNEVAGFSKEVTINNVEKLEITNSDAPVVQKLKSSEEFDGAVLSVKKVNVTYSYIENGETITSSMQVWLVLVGLKWYVAPLV